MYVKHASKHLEDDWWSEFNDFNRVLQQEHTFSLTLLVSLAFFVMHIMLLRCTFHNSVPSIIVVIMGMFFLPHHNVCSSQLFILSTLSCHNYGAILLFFTQDSRVLSTLTSYTQILSMLTPPWLFSLLIPKGLM